MQIMEYLTAAPLIKKARPRQAEECAKLGFTPELHIFLAHDMKNGVNKASEEYVGMKQRYGETVGVDVRMHSVGVNAVRGAVELGGMLEEIDRLNKNEAANGIMLQLPLPIDDPELKKAKEIEVCDSVDLAKDIDGLAKNSPFEQATPLGLMHILDGYGIPVEGENVTVNGAKGRLIGESVVRLLREREPNKLYEIDWENREDLRPAIADSSILVTGVGKPNLITADMLRERADMLGGDFTVLDAGVSKVEDEEGNEFTVGDLDPSIEANGELDIKLTRRKGAAGPMTVVSLFDNLLKAAKLQAIEARR